MKKAFVYLNISLLLTVWGVSSKAGDTMGYLSNPNEERDQTFIEMVPPAPVVEDGTNLNEVIFDKSLTRDIQRRYEDRFGRTEMDRNFILPGRYDDVVYARTSLVSFEEQAEYEFAFGEYVLRRLVEFHLDETFKNSETLRPAYQLKEQVRQANVSVNPSWRFRFKYSLSGQETRIDIENPYRVDTKIYLDEGGQTLRLGYMLTKSIGFNSYYDNPSSRLQFVLRKYLSGGFSLTLTEMFYTDPPIDVTPDNRIMFGFIWSE